jgi:hypothetical protein
MAKKKIKNANMSFPICPVSGLPIAHLCSGCWAKLAREHCSARSAYLEAPLICDFPFFSQYTLKFRLQGKSKTYLFCFERPEKELSQTPHPPAILALYAALTPLPFRTDIFSGPTCVPLIEELKKKRIASDFVAIAIPANNASSLMHLFSYENSVTKSPGQLLELECKKNTRSSESWLIISKYPEQKAKPFDFEAYKKFIPALPLVFVCFSLYGELFYHNAFGKNLLGKKFYHTLKKVARLAYQKLANKKSELNLCVINAAELQHDYEGPAVHWLACGAELNEKPVLYAWAWSQSLEWSKRLICNYYYLCSYNIPDIPLLFFSLQGKFYFANPSFWKRLGIKEIKEYEGLELGIDLFVARQEQFQLGLMQIAQQEKAYFFNIFYTLTHIPYLTLLEGRLGEDPVGQVFILIKCSFLKPIDSVATLSKVLHAFWEDRRPPKNFEESAYFFIDGRYIINENKGAARFIGENSLKKGFNLISIVQSNGENETSALQLFFETSEQDFFEESVWTLRNTASWFLELEDVKICALKNVISPLGQTRHLIYVQSLGNRLRFQQPSADLKAEIDSDRPIAYILWNEAEEIVAYNNAASVFGLTNGEGSKTKKTIFAPSIFAQKDIRHVLYSAPMVASLAAEWREKQAISVANADNTWKNVYCCQIPFYFKTQKHINYTRPFNAQSSKTNRNGNLTRIGRSKSKSL